MLLINPVGFNHKRNQNTTKFKGNFFLNSENTKNVTGAYIELMNTILKDGNPLSYDVKAHYPDLKNAQRFMVTCHHIIDEQVRGLLTSLAKNFDLSLRDLSSYSKIK